ncbi:A24 family peptidase [Aliiroseovarius crassostreae]|uniref:A24 family peptidase n=1 Tax=Aliiroseovarius crassostreae TaxID=154981 RepID=UPI0021AFD83B|nr:prepilin peptidase [Aliiroseovarius crassostreae]UWP97479.1 prepilin peptidase [Aliiroseovarius crassostreae]
MADLTMAQSASAALWFLPFAAPICVWAAVSDLKRMKIPNKAVITLLAVYAVVGLIALPLEDYAWRYLHLLVVLVLGFVFNLAGAFGAGDAKFAAAMAPFITLPDVADFLFLFCATLLIGFALHRLARAIPAVRRKTPDWESWKRKDFPMGLCLGTSLTLYLALSASTGM